MSEINFGITTPHIKVLPQTDGTMIYSVDSVDYYDHLEKLAFELSCAGMIIKFDSGCNFFSVVGEDTTIYKIPKKLKRLSARAFRKLGWNVKFHKSGDKIMLIAKDSLQLQEIIRLLKEGGFMFNTHKGIPNALYVKPSQKSEINKATKASVA